MNLTLATDRPGPVYPAGSSPWIIRPKPRSEPSLRLFCFPYAGGNASVFRTWADGFDARVEVCAVQLPGRATRMREAPMTNIECLTDLLSKALSDWLEHPFAFFGHSMGALVAFETVRALRRAGMPGPKHLFISARRAPDIPLSEPPIHNLPAAAFVTRLRELGGTPEEVLADRELLRFVMPTMRADFAVNETYRYYPEPPLDVPLTAFAASDDARATTEQMIGWRRQTGGPFKSYELCGGHFFINEQRARLLELVQTALF